jgi:hypothetical protein
MLHLEKVNKSALNESVQWLNDQKSPMVKEPIHFGKTVSLYLRTYLTVLTNGKSIF